LDFRLSLARLLEESGHTTANYASGETFLAVAASVGCVLLDVQMPCMPELAVLKAFRKRGMRAPVIVMCLHCGVPSVVRAMRAGASDFLVKPFDDESVLAMVEKLLMQPAPYHLNLEVAQAIERVATLSPREHQVLAGLLRGQSGKAIAFELKISVRTAEVHRARLMHRLGVRTLAETLRIGVLASL
jgi:two-component system response regulator FixJ